MSPLSPAAPDYRALCAELLDWAERTSAHYVVHPDVILRARAALAQPEPVAPTDEELEATARAAEIQYMKKHGGLTASTTDGLHAQLQAQRLAGLRAVLALYARPTP